MHSSKHINMEQDSSLPLHMFLSHVCGAAHQLVKAIYYMASLESFNLRQGLDYASGLRLQVRSRVG